MKDQKTRMFPENTHGMQESVITSIILTTEFLIFSNDVWAFFVQLLNRIPSAIQLIFFSILFVLLHFQLGHLVFFSLEFWTNVVTYRHTMGIRCIFSDADGTKIAFTDDHNQGFIYSPVSKHMAVNFELF